MGATVPMDGRRVAMPGDQAISVPVYEYKSVPVATFPLTEAAEDLTELLTELAPQGWEVSHYLPGGDSPDPVKQPGGILLMRRIAGFKVALVGQGPQG